MEFAKFASLLMRSELWFARPDTLGDPWEASFGQLNMDDADELEREMHRLDPQMAPMLSQFRREQNEGLWRYLGVSCWHNNEGESAAMWQLYGRAGAEIAVQTTYARLADCLSAASKTEDEQIVVGPVTYATYSELRVPPYTFAPLLYKRRSFAHEREYRAILWEVAAMTQEAMRQAEQAMAHATRPEEIFRLDEIPNTPGTAIKIDLETLIERVYVSPSSPGWFRKLVIELCSQYGLGQNRVITSELSESVRPLR
jgi:hypothetical protein